MSTALNRLRYDVCAYQKALSESVAPIDYLLDISRFEHCGKCRNELGLVGGTAVSHINGDLVALENDLFNITRPTSRCPQYHYAPTGPGEPIISPIDMTIPGRNANPRISTQMKHLRPCQISAYPEVPQPPMSNPFTCVAGGTKTQGNSSASFPQNMGSDYSNTMAYPFA